MWKEGWCVGLEQEGVVCTMMGGTTWNTLKRGGIEKRGEETKIKKKRGKLGQGEVSLQEGGSRVGCTTLINYPYIPQRNQNVIPRARLMYFHASVFDYCHSTQYYFKSVQNGLADFTFITFYYKELIDSLTKWLMFYHLWFIV